MEYYFKLCLRLMFHLCIYFFHLLVFYQYIVPELPEVAVDIFGNMVPDFTHSYWSIGQRWW